MKIRILSDTHVEAYNGEYSEKWHYQHPEFDKIIEKINSHIHHVCEDEILVLPGDLGIVMDMQKNFNPYYEKLLYYFKSRWNYIIIVPGNTEYHGMPSLESTVATESVLEKKCKEMDIIYLQKGVVKIDEYFFVGCTLYQYITNKEWKQLKETDKEIFMHPIMYKAWYVDHLEWLNNILNGLEERGDKAIVITHYPPETKAKSPRYKVNKESVTHIDKFVDMHKDTIKLWICGHVHDKHYMNKRGVPVYVNSYGEPWEKDALKPENGLIEID